MRSPLRVVATVGGPTGLDRTARGTGRRGPSRAARPASPAAGGGPSRSACTLGRPGTRDRGVLVHEARAAGIIGSRTPSMGRDATEGTRGQAVDRCRRHARRPRHGSITVPERDIRAYYDRNRDRYRRREARRIRHVVLSDEASAGVVVARLAAGEEMSPLAAAAVRPTPGAVTQGGELGEIHRGEYAGAFEDAIFSAGIGAIVGPIQTEHGWHVARVEAVVEESYVPYAEARPAIEAELLTAARVSAFAAWLERPARGARHDRTRFRTSGAPAPRSPEPQALTGEGRAMTQIVVTGGSGKAGRRSCMTWSNTATMS